MTEATYLNGLAIDEPLTRTHDGVRRSFLADALGSTVALTDDSGALTTQYAYEPFGATTQTGGDANPFQYTAREKDATDVYYYRTRYYASQLQRFISEDPIELARGDTNRYAYARNRPTMLTDPLGLQAPLGTVAPGLAGMFVIGPPGPPMPSPGGIPGIATPGPGITVHPPLDPFDLCRWLPHGFAKTVCEALWEKVKEPKRIEEHESRSRQGDYPLPWEFKPEEEQIEIWIGGGSRPS